MGYFVYASLFQLLFNIAFTYTTSLLLITDTPINNEGNLECNICVQKTNQTITARCIKTAPIVRDVFTSFKYYPGTQMFKITYLFICLRQDGHKIY